MKNPRLLARQLEGCITELAPLIEKWIIEGLADGSIKSEDSKEAAETIAILLNIWSNPNIFMVTKDQFISKYRYMRKVFEGIGIPVIDDEVMNACLKYADNILIK